MDIVEATIKDGLTALESGAVTAVDLAALALDRVAYYDRQNTALNSICVLNKTIFEDAAASDARRKAGKIGALEGLPYTTKDSYSVKGMSVASGSPAFVDLIASQDAFVIQEIRKAGGVLIGLTNMPPMAAGGMQRGVYGRAESPYSANWLAAAFASGSSNGSGVATAASMGFWGLGEETVSSGRSPASNNACVAYTPSRGMVSIRANWPLFPT
jgi:amidase